ncbi:site-2 protease family protein [Meiothermus ruber]|jgi:Zn-dependent protease|uniref:Peptidase M50 n=1 Tax=Meiothermus ruber (strain ATCC 35948 / DSM 1279 / VKM B-1258 / 21) TaxID=504728 RepID=D3PRP4_MEIRD|nr:site-2 protease family protein [Meiothermus ruber]ADD28127.1 peptidase M50 [Meiothermus ruber DSM 1279]AGK04597.1 peptidase M50 [Meiothermus ruber DSM 1279]MCL6528838.1 site-2 protease family protein [Meiothermus ruber]MCX7802423.1 site-2 protease family protein [Meiothermus ruber]GAO75077.1 peptidase M50 [Meiothermus ruber H328]
MGLLPLLQSDPLAFVLVVLVLLISLALHEWGHAITALWMGDSTAKDQGRVTLNPIKHLDLIGSIMILLVGFGWAKPVPIYPPNFRQYRLGLFVVSIAGICINLCIATLLAGLLRWMLVSGLLENPSHGVLIVAQAMAVAASINLTLAVFNLLPIPPLDGSKILQSFLPLRWHPYIWRLEANPTYAIVAMLLLLTVFRQPLGSFLGLVRTWFFDAFGL